MMETLVETKGQQANAEDILSVYEDVAGVIQDTIHHMTTVSRF